MSDQLPTPVFSTPSVLDRALRILHLEDNLLDRRLIQDWMRDKNLAVEFVDVDNEKDFLRLVDQGGFDLILSDKSIPGFDGLVALRHLRNRLPNMPFVFVTGSMGEEAAIETIKDGATDYVLKDSLSRLIPAVQRAIRESEQEEQRRRVEEKNRQQAALLDKAQDAIMVQDLEDNLLYWNKSAERIYGWTAAEVMGRNAGKLLSTDPSVLAEARRNLFETGSWKGELVRTSRGGNALTVEAHWTLVRDDQGAARSVFAIDTDITEKKSLEHKFLRSQRMDSIGALAGGIAHDLNNALAPVMMGAELLADCDNPEDRRRFLDIVTANTRRAKELVNQILSFARGSGHRGEVVNVRLLIAEMGKMIQDTFPKSIALSVSVPPKDLWLMRGDTTEVHQVLLNLCVNARDAMPTGGKLALRAENFRLEEATATASENKPGPYVKLSVSDTGTGIPPEVLPRIFEPFYTTKAGDKGTGLGLSTVLSILKHHGGFMEIQTEAGKGTEFQIFIPASELAEETTTVRNPAALPTGHGELVLVVDDEETVRELTRTILETYGYRVVVAQNGLEAVARFQEAMNDVKLLITDTDMPHLDGAGTIRSIAALQPDLPVILVSGLKGDATAETTSLTRHMRLLEKPFSLDQLLIAVADGLHH